MCSQCSCGFMGRTVLEVDLLFSAICRFNANMRLLYADQIRRGWQAGPLMHYSLVFQPERLGRMNKNKSAVCLFAVAMFVVMTASAAAQAPVFSAESGRRAEALVKQMTLDEKVGQLNQ